MSRPAGAPASGYTYADGCPSPLIVGASWRRSIHGRDAFDVPRCWAAMQRAVRNLGRSGLAASAISAVDTALWDLKASLLDLPLARLLGRRRDTRSDLRQRRLHHLFGR